MKKMYTVGITTSLLKTNIAPIIKLDDNYIKAVRGAGAMPLMIPVYENLQNAEAVLDCMDALIMSGGVDVSPLLYGEDPEEESEIFQIDRDYAETALFRGAMKRNMPILAVCRGMQLVNVILGGSLFQDLKKHGYKKTIHKRQPICDEGPDDVYHFISIDEDSRFFKYMGTEEIIVNSLHHQAIKEPAPGLIPVARSRDGVIEAVEMEKYRNFWGFQFHPERMLHEKGFRDIFKDFVGSIGDENE